MALRDLSETEGEEDGLRCNFLLGTSLWPLSHFRKELLLYLFASRPSLFNELGFDPLLLAYI